MNLDFNIHRSASQERGRAALELGHANNAARTPAPAAEPAPASDVRARLGQRLGLSDPNASNEEIFAALDSTLAAAKAKRVHVDAADALYNKAWGDSTETPAPTPIASPVDAALYELAFGKRMGA